MISGRWSDDSSWTARHELRSARLGVARDTSGDVGSVLMLYGLRVGVEGLLRVIRLGSCWSRVAPRGVLFCCVYHVVS